MAKALRDRRIWEVTLDEFVRLATQPSVPRSRQPLRQQIERHISHQKSVLGKQLLEEILSEQAVPADLFERTSPDRLARLTHYAAIQRALQAGWPVPWRAVKDYPALLRAYQHTTFGDRAHNQAYPRN